MSDDKLYIPDQERCPRCEKAFSEMVLPEVHWVGGRWYCSKCSVPRQLEMQGYVEVAPDKWRKPT